MKDPMSQDLKLYSNPVDVLNHHAKSFSWGGLFLGKKAHFQAASLYSFCRYVDDVADEEQDKVKAKELLDATKKEIQDLESKNIALVNYINVIKETHTDKQYALDLIHGVQLDLEEVRIKTLNEFIEYCYYVAGTVGGMMCPILDVTDKRAINHAIDMGIAMQITNICRDILEDAKNNRVYLPEEVLKEFDTNHDEILSGNFKKHSLQKTTKRLLSLANEYYSSGYYGLKFIPLKNRFAIYVAAKVYQAIGFKIRARNYISYDRRVYLSKFEKVVKTASLVFRFFARVLFKANSKVKPMYLNPHNKA